MLLAGVAAGVINAVVGSGSLITFPVLMAVGYPPLVANMSNSVGLVPGNFTGAYGYRHELGGQSARIVRLGAVSLVGAIVGAVLLLKLPPGAFTAVVPWLILLAGVLVLVQPLLRRALDARRGTERTTDHAVPLYLGIFGCAVYGGYFGAAQGIIMMALFGLFVSEDLQRLNGVKNISVGLVNSVAAIIFIVVGQVAWLPALLLAVGSTIGGYIGAKIGRRLPPNALRACIVVVSVVAFTVMMLR
ncbi:sulfite exporter TauE/SafE family protein [Mycolicibacterium llatzerense]|uniref:sulfite exporter TauE/SafE family protein n=1 Tax=Mycolicibacterium llatzerense TaxID=280871 RepID=UPI00338A0098